MPPVREALDRFFDRRTFEEAITLLLTAIAAVVTTVFALGRALSGSWLIAGLDALGAILAVASWFHVWRTGRAIVIGRLWLGLTCVLIVTIAWMLGPPELLWAFPLTATAFFLFPPLPAVALVAAMAAALAGPASELGGWTAIAVFYGVLIAGCLLAVVVSTSIRYSRAALTELAEQDSLLGIGNRRALNASFRLALQRRAGGTPESLLLLDIDHFKAVNDTYGHTVGDRILVELTAAINDTVRASDDVFRYGGEELLVFAHGATTEAAAQLAETLRRRIAEATFDQNLGITVSIGVAEAEPADTPTSWFRRVDALLYQAKGEGRNRVRVHRDSRNRPASAESLAGRMAGRSVDPAISP